MATGFDIPILLVMFNRPEQTQQVFDAIRRLRPQQLFVCADGPREGHPTDAVQTQRCRELVQQIDWDCKVEYLFRDKNLGCKMAVSGGITWFFEQVAMGIILEDDCLPNDSFFMFCREMLIMYKDEERVMHVGSGDFQLGITRSRYDYFFSRHPHIWGWASWQRAWKYFTLDMSAYPQLKQETDFYTYLDTKSIEETYTGKLNTWDSQWVCSIYRNRGMAILPKYHLVKNIGFDHPDATNTSVTPKWFTLIQYGKFENIKHPPQILLNDAADLFTVRYIYYRLKDKWRKKLFNYLPFSIFRLLSSI